MTGLGGMTGRIVRQFETGYQRTLITVDADRNHRWTRLPGTDRGSALHGPSPAVAAALAGLAYGGVRVALATGAAGGGVSYPAPGSGTAAGLALSHPEGPDLDRLAWALTGTGGLLRRIQAAAPADIAAAGPAGPARALAWMRTGGGPRAAAVLHRELRRSLGAARWDELMRWCAALARPSTPPPARGDVLLHGAAGMGQVVLAEEPPDAADEPAAPGPASAALLVGEDIARGPADFDLGWLLGELVELRALAAGQGRRPEFPGVARAAVLAGAGGLTDPVQAGRAAVLRMLVHAHDFAAYVGWHPDLLVHLRALPDLVDTGGDGVLTEPW